MAPSHSSDWRHSRAKVASLSRSRSADDPELFQARQNLKAARLREYIESVLREAPPLTNEQREALAAMLAPAGTAGGGQLAG